MGSNITETVTAPIILTGGVNFANWTPTSVSFQAGGSNSGQPVGFVNSGTNNLLLVSGSITATTAGTLFMVGPGSGQLSGNLVSGATAATSIQLGVDSLGTWTLSGSNSFSPLAASNAQVYGGTLALDFTTVSASNSKINSVGSLTLGGGATGNQGGTLMMVNNSANLALQQVKNTNFGPGSNNISFSGTGTGGSAFYAGALGPVVNGATLNFNLPAGTQSGSNGVYVLTANGDSGPNANGGVIGGWATVNQTDWATSTATATTGVATTAAGWVVFPGATVGQEVAFPTAPTGFTARQTYYVIAATSGSMQLAATPGGTLVLGAASSGTVVTGGNINPISTYLTDTWASGSNTTVSSYVSPGSGSTTNTLRFNADNAGSNTLTLSGTNTITTGGLLVTPNVSNAVTITGGNLASGGQYYVNQYGKAPLTIASNLVSNQNFVKSGTGVVVLSGNNTGLSVQNVYVNAGTVQVASPGALGVTGSNSLYVGNGATFDLNGQNVAVRNIITDNSNYSDSHFSSCNQLSGSQAARLGLTSNVTNSTPGTRATLTVGDAFTPVTAGSWFSGGFTEAPGAILSLNYVGSAQAVIPNVENVIGGANGSNSFDLNNNNGWNNTITGGISVGVGAVLGFAGGGAFNMDGALTVNGGIYSPIKQADVNSTYLRGSGILFQSSQCYELFSFSHLGSVPDDFSSMKIGPNNAMPSSFTLQFGGAGSYSAPLIYSSGGQWVGGSANVSTPGIVPSTMNQNMPYLTLVGSGTTKVTGGAASTSATPTQVLPGQWIKFGGPTLAIAPSGSNGNVFVQDGFITMQPEVQNQFFGATTLLLDRGANTSLNLSFGSLNPNLSNPAILNRVTTNTYGTLVIASAQGLSALGVSNKFNLFSYAPVNAFPVLGASGIVSPWIVGQDAGPGSTKAGTFLTYSYSGATGSNTDAGFNPVVFAHTDDYATAAAGGLVEHVTQNVSLPGWSSAQALQLDNATISGVGVSFVGTAPFGLIMNGGTISSQLSTNGNELDLYTSLSGGTISGAAQFNGAGALVKFGPGELVLTASNQTSSTSVIIIQAGVLDVSAQPFVSGASNALGGNLGSILLHGGVLQGNGTFTRTLGTGSGQVSWTNGGTTDIFAGGGFSAKGGPLTVTLSGGPSNGLLIWGGNPNPGGTSQSAGTSFTNGYFVAEHGVLNFGAPDSNNVVTLTNNIELGVQQTDAAVGSPTRVISVAGATADAGFDPLTVSDYTILSGTIQSSNPYHFLVKDGNGVLALTGSNTYSGGTQIANGTLVVNTDSTPGSSAGGSLGVAPVAPYPLNLQQGMNGGAITPGGVIIGNATLASGTAVPAFTLNANRTLLLASGSTGANPSNIDVYTGNTFTVPGLIGDYMNELGNLGKIGGGTLVISGSQANPFTGGLTINNGTVQNASPNSANVLGSGNVTFGTANTPTLDLNGHNVTVGLLSGAGANGVITTSSSAVATLALAGLGTQSYAGAINNGSGTVALTLMGGTQILTGANGFTGTITLNGGTLQATNAALNASDLTYGIVFNGGALRAGAGGISTGKPVTMTGAGTFDTNGNNSTLSGSITGAGGLTKAGNGTLVLSSALNSFSGGLTVNSGTVQAGAVSGTTALGSGNVSFVTSNSPTVDLNGNNETVGLLSGLGSNGVITSSGTGAVTLSLNGSGMQIFGGSVKDGSGTVSLTVNGGTQILNGVNTYSGLTTIDNGGSLTVTGTGAIPNTSGLYLGGTTNGAFNFVTGTTGLTLNLTNLTLPSDSGTSSIGVELGNSINVVNVPGGFRTVRVNIFGVFGVNPDPTKSGTTYNVLTAPSGLDDIANYTVGNVYGATNFTVGAPTVNLQGGLGGTGNIVMIPVSGVDPIPTAYWKGGFTGGSNVWAISDGNTTSNWTTNGSLGTGLVPGVTANVTITGTASSGQEGNMMLGANMAVNSLTMSDTNAVLLQDAINTLTVSGTKGIAANASSSTVNLNAGLVLNGTASQALTANNATGLLISGPISGGANGITVNGTNVVTLSGNNSFTGPVTVSAGTLKLTGTNAFTGALTLSGASLLNTTTAGINGADTTNGITFGTGGATLQAAASGISTAKAVTMTGAGTIDASVGNVTLSGAITGAGTLTKIGAGTLVLGGSNNAYTGGVTINNGTVQLANNNPNVNGLTSGILTFGPNNTPVLDLNDCSANISGFVQTGINNGYSNGRVTNNALDSGTGTLTFTLASGTTVFGASVMDGATAKVTLVKNGAGVLSLYGYQNTFTGGLTINQGTVRGTNFSNTGADCLGAGIVTFGSNSFNPTLDLNYYTNGGAVDVGLLAGTGTNGVITSSSAATTLTIVGQGVQTYNGTIQEISGKTISLTMGFTAGTQILTGSGNFTGAITLTGGILSANSLAINAGNTTNGITFNGNGILQANGGGIATGKVITINDLYMAGFDTNGSSTTLSGVVIGTAKSTIQKLGAGTLFVTNTGNQFLGLYDIAGGVLNVSTGNLSATVNGTNYTYASMDMTGGTVQVTSGSTLALTKPILLPSAYSGGTIDTNGTTVPISGVVSGPGSLTLIGGGTMQLTGANTFSGGLVINNGAVIGGSANAGAFGSGDVFFGASNSPTLDMWGSAAATIGALSGGTNAVVTSGTTGATVTLTISNTDSQTFSGVIQTGSATTFNLTKTGVGTQILTGANTYNGILTLSGGVLNATTAAINGGSVTSGIVFNTGTLQAAAGGISTGKAVTMTGVGTFDTNGNDCTLSGTMSGASALTKTGAGTLYISGTANSNTGTWTLNGGTLNGYTATLNAANAAITFNGGTLQVTSGTTLTTAKAVTLNSAGGTIDTSLESGISLLNGGVGGVGALTKTGAGYLQLVAANTFSGGMVILSGTVLAKSTSVPTVFGSGNVTFGPSNTPTLDLYGCSPIIGLLSGSGTNGLVNTRAATTLILNGTGTQTFAGTIQNYNGTMSLTGSGGTQILSGVNTYTGATVISGSTSGLIVSGSLTGTASVTVQNGGVLGGAGLINSATSAVVSVAVTGGTIAPGNLDGLNNSTQGKLTMGSLNLSAGGTNAHLSMQLGGIAVNGVTPSDRIGVSGTANVTGADLLTSLIAGYTPTPGDTFFLVINGSSEVGNFTTVNGLAGSYGQDQVFALNGVNYELSYNASYNGGVGSLFDNPGIGTDIALMVAVPEPGTWALLLGGMGMLGLWQRRRSKV